MLYCAQCYAVAEFKKTLNMLLHHLYKTCAAIAEKTGVTTFSWNHKGGQGHVMIHNIITGGVNQLAITYTCWYGWSSRKMVKWPNIYIVQVKCCAIGK